MLCIPISYYPNQIDEMIFFQDINLENIEIMNHYMFTGEKGQPPNIDKGTIWI